MENKKEILVTGGAGYIGSHTVLELLDAGFQPIIVDDFRNSNATVISGLKNILGFVPTIHRIDVCDPIELENVFKEHNFFGIIHFAADKAVGESVTNPLKYYRNNIGGLVNLLELALKYKVHNFVFSSSCTVYGEPQGMKDVTEETPKSEPKSPYGNTKLIGEAILADLQKAHPDFKVINLRYFNPIGAHPSAQIGEFPIGKPNNLLPYVTQTAIGKLDHLVVFGNDYNTKDGTCIRDFIHVCDLAQAHVNAVEYLMNSSGPCLEAINIGTGKGTSVLEVINDFEKLSGTKLNWKFGPKREGDVSEIFANAQKAEKMLNWKPKYSIQDAIIHSWEWEKKLNENV